ncbi:UNVERIFIED_CONTAM: hypothetical protein FKN15_007525 [Acipenser sinensis]
MMCKLLLSCFILLSLSWNLLSHPITDSSEMAYSVQGLRTGGYMPSGAVKEVGGPAALSSCLPFNSVGTGSHSAVGVAGALRV